VTNEWDVSKRGVRSKGVGQIQPKAYREGNGNQRGEIEKRCTTRLRGKKFMRGGKRFFSFALWGELDK